jgi:hypothetical protein
MPMLSDSVRSIWLFVNIYYITPFTDRVLYTPDRLAKLGAEAASPNSVLSVVDRLSIVSDAMVLASSGLAKTSGALTVIDSLRSESECERFLLVDPVSLIYRLIIAMT